MRDDKEFNVQFCEAVEKLPCLYDFTRCDYSNRVQQDLAWKKIGDNVGEKAAVCKERWKNIRGRYVKTKNKNDQMGPLRSVDYYLAPHLHFLDPFLRTRHKKGKRLIKQESGSSGDEDDDNEKSEEDDSQGENTESEPDKRLLRSTSTGNGTRNIETTTRTLAGEDEPAVKYLEPPQKETFMEERNHQQNNEERNSVHKSEPSVDPDMAFLQSLMPDMRAMDGRTKRRFKMGVLQLADQLLHPEF